jgi:hypothetical protein
VGANAPALGTDDTIEVQIAGENGVPDDAVAAVLNVTAVDATAPGFLTVYPCDAPKPDASNVNFVPGVAVPNLVVARLSVDGTVCIWSSAPVSTIIDVAGSFPANSDYLPLVPNRVLDSRFGNGVALGKVTAGSIVHLTLAGRGGLPPNGVSAVVLNATASNADRAGYATVFPCDAPMPDASNLNFAPGAASPNLVVARVAADGTVCLFVSETTDLIADVNGYFPTGSNYTPTVPGRVLDTRFGVGAPQGRVAADGVVRLQLPAGSPAVVLNTTAANATASGFVTVYPCDAPRPDASNLNVSAGRAIPNLVISRVAADGTVCLYSSTSVDLIADVNGWFPATSPYQPLVPARVLDGRHCDVATAIVDGHIMTFDYDIGSLVDLGPTSRPGQTVYALMPPLLVTADCWLYVIGESKLDGIGHRNLYRMPAKAVNPTLELAPGETGPPDNSARVLSGSPDGRYLYVYSAISFRPAQILRFDTTSGAKQVVFEVTTNLGSIGAPPTITPDGRFVLLMTFQIGLPNKVTRYDLVTGTSVAVDAPTGFTDVLISPDGTRFWEDNFNRFAPGPQFQRMRALPGGQTVAMVNGEVAGWLPTGEGLIAADGEIDVVDPNSGFTDLYVDLTGVSAYTDGPTVSWPRHIA